MNVHSEKEEKEEKEEDIAEDIRNDTLGAFILSCLIACTFAQTKRFRVDLKYVFWGILRKHDKPLICLYINTLIKS